MGFGAQTKVTIVICAVPGPSQFAKGNNCHLEAVDKCSDFCVSHGNIILVYLCN